ncbi:MAG TPA: acetyl-CoA hydrolase/transferase family protein [Clostridiales bacterium]|nr:acetyl-CoA hydrolase/transferase family protein [Clostridiales bacterium]
MDFSQYYKEHCTDAASAVNHIKSGDRVVVGHAAGEPQELVRAMVDRQEELENVEVVHFVSMGKAKYCAPEAKGHFRHNALFLGGATRSAIEEGRGDFTPCFFYEVPSLFKEELLVDVALIQVSRPDKNGYVSLGISVDYTKAAAENAGFVIAQVNGNMPRTMGDSFLHVSKIHCFVEHTEPLIELNRSELGEEELQIGRYCAELVPDGATLQLGIGTLPDAVLMSLGDKKDLGIHSEMFSDGVMSLVKEGVINNSRKNLHKGKIVATFIMGSRKLYEFADENPFVYMAPVDYVNNPYIIGQNDNLIAINSCVQVDLQGQVCSESIGLKQISGVGGQVDFIRGASISKGGRAIIAISSTACNGQLSKIVPLLENGAAVTTSRNDVDYIVTEYGIAKLKGKTLRERGRALINIAHPKFRDGLIMEWQKRFKTAF